MAWAHGIFGSHISKRKPTVPALQQSRWAFRIFIKSSWSLMGFLHVRCYPDICQNAIPANRIPVIHAKGSKFFFSLSF